MIARILAVALLCALVGALLDGLGFKSKKLFAILCALMLFSALIEPLGRLFGGLASLSERTGLSDALTCALRVVGIGYAVGFTADICGELGENLVALLCNRYSKVRSRHALDKEHPLLLHFDNAIAYAIAHLEASRRSSVKRIDVERKAALR